MNYPTQVFWDVESCPVPHGCDPMMIAPIIRDALRQALGSEKPILISAYGRSTKVPIAVQTGLSNTDVIFHPVPSDPIGKDSLEKQMMVDMMLWAVDHPPPANIAVISRNMIEYRNALNTFNMRTYNIILAFPENIPTDDPNIIFVAKMIWLWSELATGSGPSIVK